MTKKTMHRLVSLPMVALMVGGVISCSEGPPRGREARGGAGGGSDLTDAAFKSEERTRHSGPGTVDVEGTADGTERPMTLDLPAR